VNTVDAYQDARFDKRTDASSGFKTLSILAAPMRTPKGEIVGVVEILNKRRRNFTREDEEFLAEVATHAALAVAGLREHEAAVRQARLDGAAAVARGVMPLLLPAAWPETPGFDSAPLRWRSETPNVALYAVAGAPGRLALLLLEHGGDLEEAIGPLVRASGIGHRLLDAASPAQIALAIAASEPACAVTAARWEGDRLALAALQAPVPYLLRFGRPLPFEVRESEGLREVELETAKGDMLVIASRGLSELTSPGKPASVEKAVQKLARAAETQALSAGFAALVSDWKKAGFSPGARDALLLAARRLA
jgi:hypothetical protein